MALIDIAKPRPRLSGEARQQQIVETVLDLVAEHVFSDHLRLQFPSLQTRFAGIHVAYERRIVALLKRAKMQGLVRASLPADDAATLFLCTIQGLAFQFAIARRPMQLRREADRVLALYLRAIANPLSPRQPSDHRRRRARLQ